MFLFLSSVIICGLAFRPAVAGGASRLRLSFAAPDLFSLCVGLNRCGPVQVPMVPGLTGVPCWGLWGKPPVGLGPSLGCPAELHPLGGCRSDMCLVGVLYSHMPYVPAKLQLIAWTFICDAVVSLRDVYIYIYKKNSY